MSSTMHRVRSWWCADPNGPSLHVVDFDDDAGLVEPSGLGRPDAGYSLDNHLEGTKPMVYGSVLLTILVILVIHLSRQTSPTNLCQRSHV